MSNYKIGSVSSSEPKLEERSSSLIRYLVSVAEFTDLSGNQVSLVVLHLHGIDILLGRKERRQKNTHLAPSSSQNTQRAAVRLHYYYLLFLLFPLLVARLAVRVL